MQHLSTNVAPLSQPIRTRAHICSLLVILLLFTTFMPAAPPSNASAYGRSAAPLIVSITPRQIYNDQTTTVTISGAGFVDTPVVTAAACFGEKVVLTDITVVSPTTLTVVIPAGIEEGSYIFEVANPDGQRTVFPDFIIMRRGDTTAGWWEMTTSMTRGRNRFAAVAAQGYLFALGGNGINSSLSAVERAAINSDGSLGPWQLGRPLSYTRSYLSAVAVGNSIYILGGSSGASGILEPFYSSVQRATVAADGSLGHWEELSSMTTARLGFAVVVANGYMYALGGVPGNGWPMNSVEWAQINDDGSLGSWQLTSPMSIPRSSAVAAGGYLYALGGFGGAPDNSVERAKINADGSLDEWQPISTMVKERAGSSAVVLDGTLYVLGSYYPCITGTNTVESAVIKPDGSLGPWQLTASMLVSRADFAAVAYNGHLYALGGFNGWNDSPARSVEYLTKQVLTLDKRFYLPVLRR